MVKQFRDTVLETATIALAIAGVVLAASVVWERAASPRGPAGPRVERPIEDWETYARVGHRLGPVDAPVTVIEFGDYQCPWCKRVHEPLMAVRRAFPESVAVVYRHYPLASHSRAYWAARVAECAGAQGHFEEVHDVLYRAIDLVTLDATAVAEAAEVTDAAAFHEYATADGPVPAIERDLKAVEDLGLRGTPSIIINGTYLAHTPDSADLHDRVRKLLSQRGAEPRQ